MTDPIQRKTQLDPQRLQSYEQLLTSTTEALLGARIPVGGPGPQEQAAIERRKATVGLKEAALHGAAHGVAHKAAHSASLVARGLGKAAGGVMTAHLVHSAYLAISGPPEPGIDAVARARQVYSAATLRMAEGVLPRDFIEARRQQLLPGARPDVADGLLSEMNRRLTTELRSPEKAQQAMTQLQATARRAAVEGMEYAVAFELKSDEQLRTLLARDASLRARYGEDLAFREGVNSVVWLAQHNPAEFEDRRHLFEQLRAPSQDLMVRHLQGRR